MESNGDFQAANIQGCKCSKGDCTTCSCSRAGRSCDSEVCRCNNNICLNRQDPGETHESARSSKKKKKKSKKSKKSRKSRKSRKIRKSGKSGKIRKLKKVRKADEAWTLKLHLSFRSFVR